MLCHGRFQRFSLLFCVPGVSNRSPLRLPPEGIGYDSVSTRAHLSANGLKRPLSASSHSHHQKEEFLSWQPQQRRTARPPTAARKAAPRSFPWATASSSSRAARKRSAPAASSSPTPPARSRSWARSSPSAPAARRQRQAPADRRQDRRPRPLRQVQRPGDPARRLRRRRRGVHGPQRDRHPRQTGLRTATESRRHEGTEQL